MNRMFLIIAATGTAIIVATAFAQGAPRTTGSRGPADAGATDGRPVVSALQRAA